MVDFETRGFRTSRPEQREILETHARSFLDGFNLAASRWPTVHAGLDDVAQEERGFAYEGAGMYASLRDSLLSPRQKSLAHLISGPGDRYVHLIHVGAGWGLSALRIPGPIRLPRTPLLRWLALDGAGFAETFFGGQRVLAKRACGSPTARWQVRMAGCGRALWFLQSADIAGIAAVIGELPARARPHLWSGVGLAAGYAGAVDGSGLEMLVDASGPDLAQLKQGVVFAAAARMRSGVVPAHTELVCRKILSADVDQARQWADAAAEDLALASDVDAYLEWRTRIRRSAAGVS
jgi:hypothetical protein